MSSPRARAVIALLAGAVTASVLVVAPGAGAGGGAGASGRGDEIISSILAATSNRTPQRPGIFPRCRWHTLTDEQVVFLVHVAASRPELLTAAFLERIDRYTNLAVVAHEAPPAPPAPVGPEPDSPGAAAASPTTAMPTTTMPATTTTAAVRTITSVTYWQLTVRICDGVARTMDVRARTVTDPGAMASTVARGAVRQSTLLPPPIVTVSPPPRDGRIPRTVVGEPVFFSTTPPGTVRHRLSYGGRTVEVTAVPTGIELFSGQPGDVGDTVECGGFGVPYDPAAEAGPSRQARQPGSCVLFFDQATGSPRRDAWLGYVRMNWRGTYRVDGGASVPLDGLFSLSLVSVAVDEVDTAIQGHSKLRPHSRRKSTSEDGASGAGAPGS